MIWISKKFLKEIGWENVLLVFMIDDILVWLKNCGLIVIGI